MPHDAALFLGSWNLVDWRIEYSDGGVTRPFGENPVGYIVYTPDGIMTATIARTGRAPFGMANARNADAASKAAAFDSYFSYAGPWRIEDDCVIHELALSLNPDMTGTVQRRLATFSGGSDLELSATEPVKGGGHRRHVLQWRRG